MTVSSIWCLAAALSISAVAPRSALAQRAARVPTAPSDLDAFVTRVMKQFHVPGIGLAIVKDGRAVVTKGYGVRSLATNVPVDAQTLFCIASNTKAFTATSLGLLVQEGKIEWDAPVVRYLPSFAMYDPWVTREITVRDLLVHRSGLGLGAGDLLWWPGSDYTRPEIVQRLRYIKPATSFRSAYAYDNVLYSVAGELIEAVSGQSWEDFVRTRILEKVGMTGSYDRLAATDRGSDVATPHADIGGTMRPITPFANDNVNPAGGISSSAADMARWVIVQLDSGRMADGTHLFTPALTRQLWSIVTPIRVRNAPPDLAFLQPHFNGYALGFGISDYRGHQRIQHSGGLPGFVSLVTMIPDQRLGVVVLTNAESGEAFSAITNHILDAYLGAPREDYLAIYTKLHEQRDKRLAQAGQTAESARDSLAGPSLPLAKYAGTYTDAWYGDVTVALDNGKLVMRFTHTPALTGTLQHWQYDTFVARWNDRELRADAYVTFDLNPDGSIEAVRMAPASPDVDFSFDFQDLHLQQKRDVQRR